MLEALLMMRGYDQTNSLLKLLQYFQKGTEILQSLCLGSISKDEIGFLDREIGQGPIDALAGFIKQFLINAKYLNLGSTENLSCLNLKDLRSEILIA